MGHARNKGEKRQAFKQKMNFKRKEVKQHSQEKRGRLVVKNLPFKTTEESLRAHYEKFGTLKDIQLLKRPDGKLVGCGFVQYEAVQQAAMAKHHTNGQEFMGRKITCEFAISKDRYLKKIQQDKNGVKSESMDVDTSVIKIEDVGENGTEENSENIHNMSVEEVKDEVDEEDINDSKNGDDNIKNNDEDIKNEDDDSTDEKASDDDDEEEEAATDDDEEAATDEEASDAEEDTKSISEVKKPHVVSNDVSEGKTIFIKNLPFEATNQDLKECMRQFGPIYYALVCMDKATEHSKGTGFVKFQNKDDADKCLEAGTELKLFDNILDCHIALNRNDVQKKSQDKDKQKQHDSRNLYLIKEGVILAGSKAAESVSSADMAKRLQLEQYKTQMLRNLNMYISRNRLIIHNLPATWDNSKLTALFKKHAGPKSVIKESKIMRDLKNVDSNGVGTSKEYGFVSFSTHEHALNALRSLNNNPNIFTGTKRPIVAFSIENKVMVKAKEKRMEQSRVKNPLSKQYDSTKVQNTKVQIKETDEFSGVAAKPGQNKMRSRYNLKTQAQLHHETLKSAKKKKKMSKKSLKERSKDFIRQPQQKQGKRADVEDDFSKIVNDYKKKLIAGNAKKLTKTGTSKWYE